MKWVIAGRTGHAQMEQGLKRSALLTRDNSKALFSSNSGELSKNAINAQCIHCSVFSLWDVEAKTSKHLKVRMTPHVGNVLDHTFFSKGPIK